MALQTNLRLAVPTGRGRATLPAWTAHPAPPRPWVGHIQSGGTGAGALGLRMDAAEQLRHTTTKAIEQKAAQQKVAQ